MVRTRMACVGHGVVDGYDVRSVRSGDSDAAEDARAQESQALRVAQLVGVVHVAPPYGSGDVCCSAMGCAPRGDSFTLVGRAGMEQRVRHL